jgi:hypothetical protein
MRQIRPSGLMSGEGKRSHWPSLNATAPFLDSTISRQALVNQRLRQRHIVVLVALVMREFGNAVVDQLTRGFFDRGEIAARDVRLDPCFLFGPVIDIPASWSMLERRESSTGCNGTVCRAAICASLRRDCKTPYLPPPVGDCIDHALASRIAISDRTTASKGGKKSFTVRQT